MKSIFVLVAFAAQAAFAYDFTIADELYAQRDQGNNAIASARQAYTAALRTNLTRTNRIYAVEQLSRLDYYQGAILPENAIEEKKTIYTRCLDTLELIAPERVGPTAAYNYWKGTCLGSWGKANGILASLNKSKELVDTIEEGLRIDATYEGGGLHRLFCTVYEKLPAVNPRFPFQKKYARDLELAKTHCERAIASPAYSGAQFPETATGDYFYNVYEFYADLLIALNRKDDAKAQLEIAIERIEAEDIAPDRVPETLDTLRVLKMKLAQIR